MIVGENFLVFPDDNTPSTVNQQIILSRDIGNNESHETRQITTAAQERKTSL